MFGFFFSFTSFMYINLTNKYLWIKIAKIHNCFANLKELGEYEELIFSFKSYNIQGINFVFWIVLSV